MVGREGVVVGLVVRAHQFEPQNPGWKKVQ